MSRVNEYGEIVDDETPMARPPPVPSHLRPAPAIASAPPAPTQYATPSSYVSQVPAARSAAAHSWLLRFVVLSVGMFYGALLHYVMGSRRFYWTAATGQHMDFYDSILGYKVALAVGTAALIHLLIFPHTSARERAPVSMRAVLYALLLASVPVAFYVYEYSPYLLGSATVYLMAITAAHVSTIQTSNTTSTGAVLGLCLFMTPITGIAVVVAHGIMDLITGVIS